MSAQVELAPPSGRALRRVALRVVLTSGVLGGWFAIWWMLSHARGGIL